MPLYEFHILCKDGDITCKTVMESMRNNFKKVEKKQSIDGDHMALKECTNITEANEVLKKLLKKYKDNIRTVTIIPK